VTRSDLLRTAGPQLDDRAGNCPAGAAAAAPARAEPADFTARFAASRGFRRFYVAVLVVQGVHVIEHVIQLVQVYVLGIADDDALGLLGYVFQFDGTEEYLHLAFNGLYLLSLYVVLIGVIGWWRSGRIPAWVLVMYAGYATGLESWHMVEHIVIIRNAIRNGGCPCPGIGDVALGVTDTQLHFVYNLIAYAGTVLPAAYLLWARRSGRPVRTVPLPRSPG